MILVRLDSDREKMYTQWIFMLNGQIHQNYRMLMLIKVDALLNSKTDVVVNIM